MGQIHLKQIIIVLVIIGVAFFLLTKQLKNIDENNLPKFIKANVVNPEVVTSVSKFRSGAGHSNPGWPETCRSMKHYLDAHDNTKKFAENIDRYSAPAPEYAVDIYSPVDGRLFKGGTGEGDDQINILVDGAGGFSIRLEHVHLNPGISNYGGKVKAGQKIATVWNGQSWDLSVFYDYYRGEVLVSYFQVLPDSLFAAWQAQGLMNRSDVILTREYRDAHPLKCLDDRSGTPSFADQNGKPTENWIDENFVRLSGYGEAQNMYRDKELSNINSFEDCARHYPVLETLPKQCRTINGQTFIE